MLELHPPRPYDPAACPLFAASDASPEDLLEPSRGLVNNYANLPPYYDEPRFFHVLVRLAVASEIERDDEADDAILSASGASLDKRRALWKALGEAVERNALVFSERVELRFDSYANLAGNALDPNAVVGGSSLRPPDRGQLSFGWVPGFRVGDSEAAWIPAQLVYVPYVFQEGEPLLRGPMSTGAAAGPTLAQALYRGLLEVIERDAFMLAWLGQGVLSEIRPDGLPDSSPYRDLCHRTLEKIRRYRLEPKFYLLPTDTPAAAVMCVLWDRSGIGPPVTVGAKASCDLTESILGALEEAQQLRPWLRSLLERKGTPRGDLAAVPGPATLTERAELWLTADASRRLKGWLATASVADVPSMTAPPLSLGDLIASVEACGGTAYAVDLTPDLAHRSGLSVAKVVVPQFQPLYLDERIRDIAWPRVARARKLGHNEAAAVGVETYPHPFL